MSALAIVQVRMGSTRLPGKARARIGGVPCLELVCRAAVKAGCVTVIAAADDGDWYWTDPWRERLDIPLVVADHLPDGDVLGRFVDIHRMMSLHQPIVRLTADCPLVPVGGIMEVVRVVRAGQPYAETRSDLNPEGMRPNGIDVQAFTPACLLEAAKTRSPMEREHLTHALHRAAFTLGSRPVEVAQVGNVWLDDLPPVSITLDTPADLLFLNELVARIGVSPTLLELGGALQQEHRRRSIDPTTPAGKLGLTEQEAAHGDNAFWADELQRKRVAE